MRVELEITCPGDDVPLLGKFTLDEDVVVEINEREGNSPQDSTWYGKSRTHGRPNLGSLAAKDS